MGHVTSSGVALQSFFGNYTRVALPGVIGLLTMGPAALLRIFLHREILEERALTARALALSSVSNTFVQNVADSVFGYGKEYAAFARALDITASASRLADQATKLRVATSGIYDTWMYGSSFENAAQSLLGNEEKPPHVTRLSVNACAKAIFQTLIALGDLYYVTTQEEDSSRFVAQNFDYLISSHSGARREETFLHSLGFEKSEIAQMYGKLKELDDLRQKTTGIVTGLFSSLLY